SLHSYMGGWPEYVRVREERRSGTPRRTLAPGPHGEAEPRAPAANGSAAAGASDAGVRSKRSKPKPQGPSKNRLSEQQKAEGAVEAAESALRAVEDELADPAAWATPYESAKAQARHTAARRAVEAAYARLEALID
ncbi:MAG: ABC transporter C-terminal domain-containing protein, partial [Actinomycetota bacterium]|nr:ABC transporter C-terminal domain-containing protein [Actinomycetota bacterium]